MNTQPNSIQSCIINPKTTTNANLPYGNLLQRKPPNSFRLYLQNINGIYKGNSWDDWKSLTKYSNDLQIDVLCLTETNITWNPKIEQIARSLAQKATKNCMLSTSSHKGFSFGMYQAGGTATAIVGNATGRIMNKIYDTTNMGRWSGSTLHTNHGKNINIITVYQSTKSYGINTYYTQQLEQLKQQQSDCLDPRRKLLWDLQQLITKYNKNHETTILLMDANDGLYTKQSYFQISYIK